VISFTVMSEFVSNNVEQKVLVIAGVLSTVLKGKCSGRSD